MSKMRKAGRYGIGFIDPNTINEETWSYEHYKQEVENNMLEFLKRLITNADILPLQEICQLVTLTIGH